MAQNGTSGQGGKFVICGRCHGTGEARFNHMNGDTYCYLCMGEGIVYRATAAEKEREAAEDKWGYDAYFALVGGSRSFRNQIRRPVREATETARWLRQAERDAMSEDELAAYEAQRADDDRREQQLTRRLTFWVAEGREEMQHGQGEERRARKAAALAAAKADPKLRAKLEKAWDTYIAAAPTEIEAGIRARLREMRLPA